MSKVEEIMNKLELDNYMRQLKAREEKLKAELNDVRETLGEAGHGLKNWLNENRPIWLTGAACLFIGLILGAISGSM